MKPDWNLVLKRLVGALVWGLALAIGAWSISVSTGILGGFLGGVVGFLTGPLLARTRLRTPTILIGGSLLGGVGIWLAGMPARNRILAGALGPELAYSVADGTTWFLGGFLLVGCLHAATVRHASFMALELTLVCLALITPLSAHRDGFISRPHFFVDPLWSQGWDPVPFLMAAGALTAATLLVLSVGRFNRRNTLIDLGILVMLVFLVTVLMPLNKLQQLAPEQKPMGQNGQQEQEQEGKPPPPMDQDPNGKEKPPQKPPESEDEGEEGQPKPVALVLFHDDFTPADGFYYFRQKTMSMFNGARLVPDTTGLADRDVPSRFPAAGSELQPGGADIVPEPTDSSLTRNIRTTVNLIIAHPLPISLINPIRMEASGNPDPYHFVRAYKVESAAFIGDVSALLGRRAGNPLWSRQVWSHYTRTPEDPRYRRLAEEIVSRLQEQYREDPMARAVMVKLWLETEGTYSLSQRILDSDDAVARFLFGDKVGYCVHFAHAATYLVRSLGVPARVATGYAADARYRFEGSALLLQDANSHAWCEIYLEGVGWVPLDVSPQRTDARPPPPPDADLQRMLGQLARKEAPSQEGGAQQKRSLTEMARQALAVLARGAGILLVLGILAAGVGKVVRRLGPYFGPQKTRTLRTFRAALDCLADVGVFRPFGDTRERFARDQGTRFEALAPLTEFRMREALGNPQLPSPPEDRELLKHYRNLARQIRRNTPFWRRLLGLLNPFSWLFVR
jgi:transglutaminase-like putative cysteine protease